MICYFDILSGVLMIDFRYFIILNLFVNDFICYHFNYVLIIFLVCCIAGRIMNISFPDFEDFSYMDDPFISGDKSFLKGTVLQVLLSPLCPRSHVMVA